MFSFDYWADWFGGKVRQLDGKDYVLIRPHDTRAVPECRLNRSFGMQLDTVDRIGSIAFWEVGLCDYQVIDVRSEANLADRSGLEATDETVKKLFVDFLSFYDNGRAGS